VSPSLLSLKIAFGTNPEYPRIGVGRTDWFRPLPPPNRTGGFPAYGSPIGGFTSKRIDNRNHRILQSISCDPEVTMKGSLTPWRGFINSRRSPGDSALFHTPEESSPFCLALGHSQWLVCCPLVCSGSTFLRSLRSIPITGLPRYYGRSDSCRIGSSVPYWPHEHRSGPRQVSLLHAHELPSSPSPTTLAPPVAAFARYPSAPLIFRLRRIKTSPFTSRLIESLWPNRVRYPTGFPFTSGCSPPRLAATQLPSVTSWKAFCLTGTFTLLFMCAHRRTRAQALLAPFAGGWGSMAFVYILRRQAEI